jgi:hypothetical protein
MQNQNFINDNMNKVLSGLGITFDEAEQLLFTDDLLTLAECANTIIGRLFFVKNGHP